MNRRDLIRIAAGLDHKLTFDDDPDDFVKTS
jgi:hypothetical protein